MKSMWKKSTAVLLTVVMMVMLVCLPQGGQISEVQAATSDDVYINPYSDLVVSYSVGDYITENTAVISIVGCTKKSQIKNLKSSNKNIKVKAADGYIAVTYGDKAGKATISCKVKGVKLKTTFTVKKYTNPLKTFKIGNKDYTKKYAKTGYYLKGKKFSKKTLTIKAKSGWTIEYVYIAGNSYTVDKSKWTKKKVSLKKKYSYIAVTLKQKKTGLTEILFYEYTG